MKKTEQCDEYIKVFGMRNHGKMQNGNPATELIYIHSKVAVSSYPANYRG